MAFPLYVGGPVWFSSNKLCEVIETDRLLPSLQKAEYMFFYFMARKCHMLIDGRHKLAPAKPICPPYPFWQFRNGL